MTLLSLLQQNVGTALCLPAHGRGLALPASFKRLLRQRPGRWDLPELPSIGGPLISDGAVADSQRHVAAAMGVDRAWYGVNGATGMLQAALLAVAAPGQAVLIPRNSHRSVLQACLLGDLVPLLFDLPFQSDRGQPAPADQAWMQRVLAELPRNAPPIAAAVLVHPTYQGYANNPTAVIQLLQKQGWPVLVDEAHGSHLALAGETELPPSALHGGADLVVHSLQKSSSGLAQTAVLWLQGQRVDPDAVERSLGWLQTTSPSALLLASCESAVMAWSNRAGRQRLMRRLQEARRLRDCLSGEGVPLLANQDPLRLVLHTGAAGISGPEADAWLLPRGLVAEVPEPATLTFCLGLAKRRGLASLLTRRWKQLLKAHPDRQAQTAFSRPPLPLVATLSMPLGQAWRAPAHCVPLSDAEGGIAAEPICPYPPGIPLLVPGEQLDGPRWRWLLEQQGLWGDQIPQTVRLVKGERDPVRIASMQPDPSLQC